ncbi:DUF362 domain-containing protein [Desulfohalovibrio reitneri]|uniref:DUF362 domain-containing protein n=1 Tax=Desulfohalovibrio reitneri TaxID=1307759 RepID=UPI0004A6E405|nr:DUF362 domain-containing protein [Desulfohalovibrio reitneri]
MSYVIHIPHDGDDGAAVEAALAGLDPVPGLAGAEVVLLKPNLINASPFPVTSRAEFVRAVIRAMRARSDAAIVIGEGCGDATSETPEIFTALGFDQLARDEGVELLDLNHAELTETERPECAVFPRMHLPEILFRSFVVSLPVLKAHTLAGITGAVKNMMGVCPPSHYAAGGWKKSCFHSRMQGSVADLYAHRPPDLSIMDASVGLRSSHLGGPPLSPPANAVLAGTDAREVDRAACGLLGMDWRDVGHLR